jgi:hypothetical protein
MNKAVAFCIRATVPATNLPAPAGDEARRSTRGVCWWAATRPTQFPRPYPGAPPGSALPTAVPNMRRLGSETSSFALTALEFSR